MFLQVSVCTGIPGTRSFGGVRCPGGRVSREVFFIWVGYLRGRVYPTPQIPSLRSGGYFHGRYASYWNAFLSCLIFSKFI